MLATENANIAQQKLPIYHVSELHNRNANVHNRNCQYSTTEIAKNYAPTTLPRYTARSRSIASYAPITYPPPSPCLHASSSSLSPTSTQQDTPPSSIRSHISAIATVYISRTPPPSCVTLPQRAAHLVPRSLSLARARLGYLPLRLLPQSPLLFV